AWPDDQTDLPVRAFDGDVHVPLMADRVLLGHVKHAPYLLDPESRLDRRFNQKVSTRHVRPSSVKRSNISRWCSSSSHSSTTPHRIAGRVLSRFPCTPSAAISCFFANPLSISLTASCCVSTC